jgi:hypothetical protein
MTFVHPEQRRELLYTASQLPRPQRHEFLRSQIAQLKAEQARSPNVQPQPEGQHP